ncbi:MAG: SDR family NAD(P)-dependent oxidoreductase [Verrucomicrobiota bacterium]
MRKSILLTGATDGIGLETAKALVAGGHQVLLHGRNPQKLEEITASLALVAKDALVESYVADLSDLSQVVALAKNVASNHATIDVLINNAGVLQTNQPITKDGLDIRFVVNTIAPYLLATQLFPIFKGSSRVINLSSAAQSTVDLRALSGDLELPPMEAYSQSKLAITMWNQQLALDHPDGPTFVAVNPASMLGSKMVKDAFGVAGGDLKVGADILIKAALSDEFADASGKYFDNDQRRFSSPHPDAADQRKVSAVVATIKELIAKYTEH